MEPLQLCIIWYFVFVISTVFHEFSHAFVAQKFGDHTATHHGLATLNPIPHIQRTPLGMVIVPLLSFIGTNFGWMIGWASVPYDPYWAQRYPKQAALMGLAGPAANLILFIVAGVVMYIGLMTKLFILPESPGFSAVVASSRGPLGDVLALMFSILFTLNLLLFIFNLIPVPPLDGTALAELLLKGEILYKYRQLITHPTVRAFGIFIAWYAIRYLFWPVYTAALFALYSLYSITARG